MRLRNQDWNCGDGKATTFDQAKLATLMDIRDELRDLNRLLNCHNVIKAARAIIRAERRLAKQVKLP